MGSISKAKGNGRARDYVDQVVEELSNISPQVDARTAGISGRLMQAALYFQAGMARIAAAHGVARGEAAVLIKLLRDGPPFRLGLTEFVKVLWVTPAGITKQVDRLAGLGLVSKSRSSNDRRVVFASLTPKGRRVAHALLRSQLGQNEARSILELTQAERRQLTRLLRKLMLTLETNVPAGPNSTFYIEDPLYRGAEQKNQSNRNQSRRTGRVASPRPKALPE